MQLIQKKMNKYQRILMTFESIFHDQPIFESTDDMIIIIRKELTKKRVEKHKTKYPQL